MGKGLVIWKGKSWKCRIITEDNMREVKEVEV